MARDGSGRRLPRSRSTRGEAGRRRTESRASAMEAGRGRGGGPAWGGVRAAASVVEHGGNGRRGIEPLPDPEPVEWEGSGEEDESSGERGVLRRGAPRGAGVEDQRRGRRWRSTRASGSRGERPRSRTWGGSGKRGKWGWDRARVSVRGIRGVGWAGVGGPVDWANAQLGQGGPLFFYFNFVCLFCFYEQFFYCVIFSTCSHTPITYQELIEDTRAHCMVTHSLCCARHNK